MQIIFFQSKFKCIVDDYQLSEEHLRDVSTPKECVQLSNEDSNRCSVLAMDGNTLVTFFMLYHCNAETYSEAVNYIVLQSFSTDVRYQGKGYAKQALKQLHKFIDKYYTGVKEIIVAINLKNEAAQRLFETSGFIDEGVRRIGPKSELKIMSYHF